jgi:hypothetical protein
MIQAGGSLSLERATERFRALLTMHPASLYLHPEQALPHLVLRARKKTHFLQEIEKSIGYALPAFFLRYNEVAERRQKRLTQA